MKKIGIFCLGTRRPASWEIHVRELSKCKYDNYQFYLLVNEITKEYADMLLSILKDKLIIVNGFEPTQINYMNKIKFALSREHEFSIKHDEDIIMTSASWDRFFQLTEEMDSNDIFCTGAISNGIPTTELFIETHTPQLKDKLYSIFANLKLGNHGADYSSLNTDDKEWNSNKFYENVTNFNHYYKGIHPVRVSFEATNIINDEILKDFNTIMAPKTKNIIKDNAKYPYLCNNIFGIKTEDWKTIISNPSLFVDNFDEVPINLFRNYTKKNLVIDAGIPIIHTMYNWTPNWKYENDFINSVKIKLKEML